MRAIARSGILNVTIAATGMGATLFITWHFGLADFAYYTINVAKLSLILIAAELLPNSFMIFRLQDDPRFNASVPVFYIILAFWSAAMAATVIAAGLVNHWSWFMVLFVFTSSFDSYFSTQAQANGRIESYFWIPAATSLIRLALLLLLSLMAGVSNDDVLWISAAVGTIAAQALMIRNFPELLNRTTYSQPLAKLAYLWSLREGYYGYYTNSLLRRARDTFLPLFCDIAVPSKAVTGHFFVLTRANRAVCSQLRVLEAYMGNRAIRHNLRNVRRRLFFILAPLGHLGVSVLALILMYPQGINVENGVLAWIAGLFVYPYLLEIFWRNDALAVFAPRKVTVSLVAFFAGVAIPPLIAWSLGQLTVAVLIGSYVLGQMLATLTYKLFRVPNTASIG